MDLCPAGPAAELDRYIGYWKPYATSHADLDADAALQEEVRIPHVARRGTGQARRQTGDGRRKFAATEAEIDSFQILYVAEA